MGRCLFAAGLITLAVCWLGPLPDQARYAFWAHMTLHMGVVAVAAPLLAIAVAGGRFDPARRRPVFFDAILASVFELAVVWLWHTPALHHAARHHTAGFVVEQGTFLAAGLMVWISALGGGAELSARRTGAGIIALLLTSMHMTLLGALLALSPRPLYEHLHRAGGLPALDDQHLGGAIMLIIGGVSYLAGGLWLTGRLVSGKKSEFD